MIPLPFTLLFCICVYRPFLYFLFREDPLHLLMSWFGGAEFSQLLFVKLLISLSYLNEILAEYSNLGCRFFSFITLSMSCHSLLAWTVSIERSAVILTRVPLWVICCFSLADFNICSLCLIFISLTNMCLGVFCLGLSCLELWISGNWMAIPLLILAKFSTIISSSVLSCLSFCLLILGLLWFECWGG